MIEMTCHCGDVRIEIEQRPDFVHDCNCSLCRKSGARWAYFAPADVKVTGDTSRYVRTDKHDASARIHFCASCGATTHFRLTASAIEKHGDTMMGVNMRLANPTDLAGVELRYPDGLGWSGEGAFAYYAEPELL